MIEKIIAQKTAQSLSRVQNTIKLLDEGATIPFIARYRKEATGSLDEVQIEEIANLYTKLTELEARKKTILTSIEEQGKLTDELKSQIANCFDSSELEDVYLPYKPKRRTRATIAREKGLEPLAEMIYAQRFSDIEQRAKKFAVGEVSSADDAIAGACDIIAEGVAENIKVRNRVRKSFERNGEIISKLVKGKEAEGAKFSDYFDAQSPVRRISSHRFLAMARGEELGVLKISVAVDADEVIREIEREEIKYNSQSRKFMEMAIEDSYKRLIKPSISTETLAQIKQRADDEAIAIFAENLRQLLLASPLGQKRVIAIDPGFRTGCKVVVLDSQGNLLHNTNIYPHQPLNKLSEAKSLILSLVEKYKTEAFAIGDGTAGRETQHFVESLKTSCDIFMVNEDGASIYSASQTARDEFGDDDVTVRGAVSIGRRLMDPLSELVKIDPKSLGVGQYQHSVDQPKLKGRLTTVVESCVNKVGVNINTASKHILTYISGLGSSLAQNIVDYRAQNGDFTSRKELLKVPRLGAKAYEQAAGFLRVVGGGNPLDNSAVHPESYHIVQKMAKDLGVSVVEFSKNKDLRKNVDAKRYTSGDVGLPTINDILEALDKQGLDPRSEATAFCFDDNIRTIDDLQIGMQLEGIVSNMTAFGAFVNIGIKQDGLVHISQICDKFISSPTEVLSLGQRVMVKVVDVDNQRGRVGLSIKQAVK